MRTKVQNASAQLTIILASTRWKILKIWSRNITCARSTLSIGSGL